MYSDDYISDDCISDDDISDGSISDEYIGEDDFAEDDFGDYAGLPPIRNMPIERTRPPKRGKPDHKPRRSRGEVLAELEAQQKYGVSGAESLDQFDHAQRLVRPHARERLVEEQ